MAKVNVEKLVELIERSELVDPAVLTDSVANLRRKSGGLLPKEPEAVAQGLVEMGVISRWQADNLLNGKYRGFWLGDGKYKLLGHLGKGGMSTVFLAENTRLGRLSAIKVLPQSKVKDSSYKARFELEARAAAKLDHPNIVRIYDIEHDARKDIHYIVMEYVDGRDLQVIVKEDGPLDYDAAASFIAQAAAGLQHAHDRGLIHRDVKPANCLVDKDAVVKVLDMGLAKFAVTEDESLTVAHDENVLGTADYLAPEQALNSHSVDSRADIYGLGCTLYFLLTGHPPFPDGALAQRLIKHQTEEPPSIYVDRPDAPADLVEICQSMMKKDPRERLQTAGDVALDLARWLATRGKPFGEDGSGSGVLAAAAAVARRRGQDSSLGFGSGAGLSGSQRLPEGPPGSGSSRFPGMGDTISAANADTNSSATARNVSEEELTQLAPDDSGLQLEVAKSAGHKKPEEEHHGPAPTADQLGLHPLEDSEVELWPETHVKKQPEPRAQPQVDKTPAERAAEAAKSLLEEELGEAVKEQVKVRPTLSEEERGLLGLSGEHRTIAAEKAKRNHRKKGEGMPNWVWAAVGGGVLLILLVILLLVLGSG